MSLSTKSTGMTPDVGYTSHFPLAPAPERLNRNIRHITFVANRANRGSHCPNLSRRWLFPSSHVIFSPLATASLMTRIAYLGKLFFTASRVAGGYNPPLHVARMPGILQCRSERAHDSPKASSTDGHLVMLSKGVMKKPTLH